MTPIVDGLEETYGQEVVFKRIEANTGDGPAIMQAYRILGHPTTLLFDRAGQEVERFIGPQSSEAVEETIQEILVR